MTARTHRQMPEMEALRRCDTLRELPKGGMTDDNPSPGGFFLMLGVAALAGLAAWAMLVVLFSVVTP